MATTRLSVTGVPGRQYAGFAAKRGIGIFTRLSVMGVPGRGYGVFEAKPIDSRLGIFTRLSVMGVPGRRYGVFVAKPGGESPPSGEFQDIIVINGYGFNNPGVLVMGGYGFGPGGIVADEEESTPFTGGPSKKRWARGGRRRLYIPRYLADYDDEQFNIRQEYDEKTKKIINNIDNLTIKIEGDEYQPVIVKKDAEKEELKRRATRTTIRAIKQEAGVNAKRAKELLLYRIRLEIEGAKRQQMLLELEEEELLLLLLLL